MTRENKIVGPRQLQRFDAILAQPSFFFSSFRNMQDKKTPGGGRGASSKKI